MDPGRLISFSLAGSILVCACSSSSTNNESTVCEPGATRTCVGVGTCSGSQACDASGTTWGACLCGTGGSAGGTGGNTGGIGGSAGVVSGGSSGSGAVGGVPVDSGTGGSAGASPDCEICFPGVECSATCAGSCGCGMSCDCVYQCVGSCAVDCTGSNTCAINCPTGQVCQLACPTNATSCVIFGCQIGVTTVQCGSHERKGCNVTPICP